MNHDNNDIYRQSRRVSHKVSNVCNFDKLAVYLGPDCSLAAPWLLCFCKRTSTKKANHLQNKLIQTDCKILSLVERVLLQIAIFHLQKLVDVTVSKNENKE